MGLSRYLHAEPIRVHPKNPHYFLFQGRAIVLITSTEHYGAVLNPDFDFRVYLDTLKAAGLNLTRTVNGSYLESTNTVLWRGGDQNPLAPKPGRYLAPWQRSDVPGYVGGGNKFDLEHWDERYFSRLKAFVAAAAERGIVVEFNAFYVMYSEGPQRGGWSLHPFHEGNNINGVGHSPWHRYNTLTDSRMVAYQTALLRRTLLELQEFDNVYYEICDEPYFSGASPSETSAWQNRMIQTFVETERHLPKKHLIAVNFANGYLPIQNLNPAISILNFHYSSPPAVVPMNWHWNRPIVFDETAGFAGHKALDRRREAWAFLLSGGAGYDNLDPSFATDDPTGSGRVAQADGTYDCRDVRSQLGILKRFMDGLDLVHFRPNPQLLQTWVGSASETWYGMEHPDKAYVVYFKGGEAPRKTSFAMDVPKGRWRIRWFTPRDGNLQENPSALESSGVWLGETPAFTEDLVLWLTRLETKRGF